jgi:hypothetical protein
VPPHPSSVGPQSEVLQSAVVFGTQSVVVVEVVVVVVIRIVQNSRPACLHVFKIALRHFPGLGASVHETVITSPHASLHSLRVTAPAAAAVSTRITPTTRPTTVGRTVPQHPPAVKPLVAEGLVTVLRYDMDRRDYVPTTEPSGPERGGS